MEARDKHTSLSTSSELSPSRQTISTSFNFIEQETFPYRNKTAYGLTDEFVVYSVNGWFSFSAEMDDDNQYAQRNLTLVANLLTTDSNSICP